MSIQTYINELSNTLYYRLQHLDRFTDNIYIPKTCLSPGLSKIYPVIVYENRADTYELCDLINSMSDYRKYEYIVLLLLQCTEHEPTRKLLTLNI